MFQGATAPGGAFIEGIERPAEYISDGTRLLNLLRSSTNSFCKKAMRDGQVARPSPALFPPCSTRPLHVLTRRAFRLDCSSEGGQPMANHKTIKTESKDAWMFRGTEAWWSSVSEYQSEMFDFMSHRLAKDSAALQQV